MVSPSSNPNSNPSTAPSTGVPAESGTPSVGAPTPPLPTVHYLAAYEQALPAAQALDPEQLIAVNIDVPTAITTAVGVLPGILALRERVAKELPAFDVKHFDQLETYALATAQAHAAYLGSSAPPQALLELSDRGVALRDLLYSDALALANRGLISGEKLTDFKSNVGYKNLAFDLLGLANVLRESWDRIASKTALQMSEIDEATLISEYLVRAVAGKEQAPVVTAEQAQLRQRNFTLFARAYDQVRRAISFLRWEEDDVDSIAPSLYAGRNTGRRKSTDPKVGTDVPAPETVPTPVSPAGTVASPNAGGAGPAPHPANAPPVTSTTSNLGLPDASPFIAPS